MSVLRREGRPAPDASRTGGRRRSSADGRWRSRTLKSLFRDLNGSYFPKRRPVSRFASATNFGSSAAVYPSPMTRRSSFRLGRAVHEQGDHLPGRGERRGIRRGGRGVDDGGPDLAEEVLRVAPRERSPAPEPSATESGPTRRTSGPSSSPRASTPTRRRPRNSRARRGRGRFRGRAPRTGTSRGSGRPRGSSGSPARGRRPRPSRRRGPRPPARPCARDRPASSGR